MKQILIKNHNGKICDYRPYIEVNINKEIENIQKLIEECHQKMIDITGIPKEKLNYDRNR